MSILDKAIAAITPPESDEARADARRQAESLAAPGGWLALVLDHHRQLESSFAAVKAAQDAGSRRAEEKKLGILLTGHANAEETVIYPAMVANGEQGGATMAYSEQAAAKTQMAMLEKLEPMSQDYLDKLEHIRGAVAHHMYEEEGTWFAKLSQDALQGDQAEITKRYTEEFERYVGGENVNAETPAFFTQSARNGVNDSMTDAQTTLPGSR